mgnify:CR=1 FL=1
MQIGKDVSFNLNVKAVQTKNNYNKSLNFGFQDENNIGKNTLKTASTKDYNSNNSYGLCPEKQKTSKFLIKGKANRTATNLIELIKKETNDNEPFKISNMFPGDSETRYYRVQTTGDSSAKVNLNFGNIDTNSELTNIVKTRIKLLPETVLYDGLLKDMSELAIPTTSGTNEMYFEIILYIDTSVKDTKYEDQDLSFNILFNIQNDIESRVMVENNLIHTGEVKVNLNNGQPVIKENENLISWHGFRIFKNFFVENEGTGNCYYKLYLSNVEGELAKFMNITIKDGEEILWKGLMSDLNEENAVIVDDELKVGQRQNLIIEFEFIGDLK